MLDIFLISRAVLEKKVFKHFSFYHYVKVSATWAWSDMTLGTSFEQTGLSLSQGCSMTNNNAFQPVVHGKNF